VDPIVNQFQIRFISSNFEVEKIAIDLTRDVVRCATKTY
jgi:hypothetical protein